MAIVPTNSLSAAAEAKAIEARQKAIQEAARAAVRPKEKNPALLRATERGYYDGHLYEVDEVFENTLNLPVLIPSAASKNEKTGVETPGPLVATWFVDANAAVAETA